MSGEDKARLEALSPVRRALHTIERLEARLEALERSHPEPIAVIGMGCRFPGGADDPDAFWRLLCEGRDAITEVPADRLDLTELYDPDPERPGRMYMRCGGFLDRVDGFDAPFFRISPREAAQMDPQQRLFLEVGWEALENAGQRTDDLAGSRTSVFAGVLSNDYAQLPGTLTDRIDPYYYPGINSSFIAGRLSYFLGLHGQSLAVDTACSSSLVAVHMACQSLRSGESDLALAGGVNLILSPEISMFLCKVKAMSPTGRCRAFDKDADGMIRGEGCGIVVLKRLSDAVAAGDNVLALIRGSAVNHDGPSGGLTVPNPVAQEMLYRAAMKDARVAPDQVCYVEAHGTGTHLGDPIELTGLAAAYCQGRTGDRPLWIGSVKTNIGHTDSAAGVANLIKTVLILKHGRIPPTLHHKAPNPQFAWKDHPIAVAQRLMPLPESGAPLIAAASAFGLSGVNAHVILEQALVPEGAPASPGSSVEEPACLLPLSAKTPDALRNLAAAYRDLLMRQDGPPLDVCRAAATRRSHLEHRLAAVGQGKEQLAAALQAFTANDPAPATAVGQAESSQAHRLTFVFPGQGAQWWAMGRELREREPAFQEKLGQIEEIFARLSGWSLLKELTAEEARSRVHDTEVAQPALFAVQVALAAVFERWGILPQAVVGHSMGEVAAAHVAGALTLEDAVRVIYHRGRLLDRATGRGKMLAANLAIEEVQQLVERYAGRVSIAAYNGPSSVVLSGEEEAIDDVLASLNENGTFCRELHVKFASHCPQMEAYQQELQAALAGIRPQAPAVPILSTVTGQWATAADFDPAYWARNIRVPVLFAAAMARLIDEGHDVFLEFNPHPILGGSISQCLESRARSGLVLQSLHREKGERQALLESLAELHVRGYPVDFQRVYPDGGGHVSLPNYPWQRKRHWLKAGAPSEEPYAKASWSGRLHPLLGERIASPSREIQFRSWVRASSPEYLRDHRISGQVVFPASGYQVVALAAAAAIGAKAPALANMSFLAPLILSEAPHTLQVVVSPADERGERACRIYSTAAAVRDGSWELHAACGIGSVAGEGPRADAVLDLEEVKGRCEELPAEALYREIEPHGYEYRGSFRSIEKLWKGPREVLSRIRLPEDPDREPDDSTIHPALLDACMHSVLATVDWERDGAPYVPMAVEHLRLFAPPTAAAWAHGTLRRRAGEGEGLLTFDIGLFDAAGRLSGELTGLSLRRGASWAQPGTGEGECASWCYEVQWEPKSIEEYRLSARRTGSWLVFAADGAVGEPLTRALRVKGHDLCLVRHGDAYERSDERTWTIDPRDPDHFRRLFRDLQDANVVCGDVVFIGAVADPLPATPSVESVGAEQDVLCGGALHLVQAVEQAGLKDVPRLWLVTQGCQTTGEEESSPDPRQATLWGLGRVIALEHPRLGCTCLDLDADGRGDQSSLIVREFQSGDGEAQVAFRHGARYVARLRRHALATRAEDAPARGRATRPGVGAVLRGDGGYLITGGLGALGLRVARWLAEHGARHLILMGRSGARGEAADEVRRLEKDGARVLIVRADVSDSGQLTRALEEVKATMPGLRGVFHAAVVLDDGVLVHQSLERFRGVLAPKVAGAWNLHVLTQDMPLELFVLFSSTVAMLGSPGQGNYAAANAFMDALAHHRRSRGLPGLSINWGPWAETGLAAGLSRRDQARWAARGVESIPPDQGLEVLGRLLFGKAAQVGVLPVDWAKFLAQLPASSPFLSSVSAVSERPAEVRLDLVRRWEEAPASERRELLEAYVRSQVARVLGLALPESIRLRQRLFDLGLDSLMAVELRNRIAVDLGRSLRSTLVFDYPTVESLVEHLAGSVLALELSQGAARESTKDTGDRPRSPASLDDLSGDEIADLLARELSDVNPDPAERVRTPATES